MKRVYGYIRRSREKENLSLQVQEKSIRAYCESQGWELVEVFSDNSTGENTLRSGYQKMLNSLTINTVSKIDLTLVVRLDRISRRLRDILCLIEDQLNPLGVGLKSVTEPFDSSTAEGRLMISMLGSFAEFERLRISERMQDGKCELAELGGWNGGYIPYGYRHNPNGKGLVPDPDNSRIVHQLFHLYASRNVRVPKIKELTSCPLHPDSIHDLLSNPFYVGWSTYDDITVKGQHEPIVSVRLFNRVQERKLERSRSYKTSRRLFKISGMQLIPLAFSMESSTI